MKGNYKHGDATNSGKSKEYTAWTAMKTRCYNKSVRSYKNYGARGIKVCDRWLLYTNFLADMGRAPSPKHSLERKNNNGNYEPGNCKWATDEEQRINTSTLRRITLNGQTKTITHWAVFLGLKPKTLDNRLRVGWSIERALSEPTKISMSRKLKAGIC